MAIVLSGSLLHTITRTHSLSWTLETGYFSDYILERCQGASCTSWAQVDVRNFSQSQTSTQTGMVDGTVYQYRVRQSGSPFTISNTLVWRTGSTLTYDFFTGSWIQPGEVLGPSSSVHYVNMPYTLPSTFPIPTDAIIRYINAEFCSGSAPFGGGSQVFATGAWARSPGQLPTTGILQGSTGLQATDGTVRCFKHDYPVTAITQGSPMQRYFNLGVVSGGDVIPAGGDQACMLHDPFGGPAGNTVQHTRAKVLAYKWGWDLFAQNTNTLFPLTIVGMEIGHMAAVIVYDYEPGTGPVTPPITPLPPSGSDACCADTVNPGGGDTTPGDAPGPDTTLPFIPPTMTCDGRGTVPVDASPSDSETWT